eukprot:NODE_1266_length_1189_cov_97.852734.p1 GENE.NODE_1266_length_1189_cov_97.852734~~NODE_1266_length_1189_cov_97.852734.p1  ORF type:complete len:329 (+),score=88.81 NODE_1266_length_1189_cov_97.852734:47-988(+)
MGHCAIQLLIEEAHMPVDTLNSTNRTALTYALDGLHLPAARLLREHGAEAGFTTVTFDEHVLRVAAVTGDRAEARRALEDRADINTCSNDGTNRTVLMFAAWHGHAPVVRLLLDAGADPTRVARNGESVQWLQHPNDRLLWAARHGDCDEVTFTLAAGGDVNTRHRDGRNPLFFALQYGQVPAVRLLLDSRADPAVLPRTAFLQSPNARLLWAAQYGDLEELRLTLAAGADANTSRESGATPLMTAVTWGHPKFAEQLLKAKADIWAKSNTGNNALMLAERHKSSVVSEVLNAHLRMLDYLDKRPRTYERPIH